MIDNMGIYQGYSVEGTAELKVTPEQASTCNVGVGGCLCKPIYGYPIEKCVHRQIIH